MPDSSATPPIERKTIREIPSPPGGAWDVPLPDGPLLIFDTAGKRAATALILPDGRGVFSDYPVDGNLGNMLFPAIDAVVKAAGVTPDDLAGVVINRGPGSWTGLRIGTAAAKTLSVALGIPVAAYSNIRAMAMEAIITTGLNRRAWILGLLDGRKAGLFGGAFIHDPESNGLLERIRDDCADSAAGWVRYMAETANTPDSPDADWLVTGCALDRLEQEGGLTGVISTIIREPLDTGSVRAVVAAIPALEAWGDKSERLAGDAVHSLVPNYLRAGHFKKRPGMEK